MLKNNPIAASDRARSSHGRTDRPRIGKKWAGGATLSTRAHVGALGHGVAGRGAGEEVAVGRHLDTLDALQTDAAVAAFGQDLGRGSEGAQAFGAQRVVFGAILIVLMLDDQLEAARLLGDHILGAL